MNSITIAFVGALLFTLLPNIPTPEKVHELVAQHELYLMGLPTKHGQSILWTKT